MLQKFLNEFLWKFRHGFLQIFVKKNSNKERLLVCIPEIFLSKFIPRISSKNSPCISLNNLLLNLQEFLPGILSGDLSGIPSEIPQNNLRRFHQ